MQLNYQTKTNIIFQTKFQQKHPKLPIIIEQPLHTPYTTEQNRKRHT